MKLKVGDIVHIRFWDHCDFETGDTTPLLFEVFGRLFEETDVHYVIGVWVYPDQPQDHNAEYYSIITGAVTGIRRLGR